MQVCGLGRRARNADIGICINIIYSYRNATLRYHDLRVHPYARFKTDKPKDVLVTLAQDVSCGGSGSVVGFSTNMLEAGKENVGGIGTRQECGDALPRCNLASVGCGCGCGLRHTHLTSPRFPSSRPVLSFPYALVGGLAWLSTRRQLATPSYSLARFPSWGELYNVVTSWHATVEDATHISG